MQQLNRSGGVAQTAERSAERGWLLHKYVERSGKGDGWQ